MKGMKCPVCGGKLRVDLKPKLGQLIKCGRCVSQFEVVDLDPVELDSIYYEDSNQEERFHIKFPMTHHSNSNHPKCPVCDSEVKTNHNLRRGDCITCTGCYVELTVVQVNPIVLDFSNNGNYNINWGMLFEDEYSK